MSNAYAGASGLLSFAAAPIFAIMALLTAVDDSSLDVLCSTASPLSGMVVMYVLMSAFHLTPWLKLVAGCQMPKREPHTL
jgi:hypothetical protein